MLLAQLISILYGRLHAMSPMARYKLGGFAKEDIQSCKSMTNTLAPVECNNCKLVVTGPEFYLQCPFGLFALLGPVVWYQVTEYTYT